MKARCNNPRNISYPRYGGRGVTYCPRWETFANFLEDMGECPEGHQLDKELKGGIGCLIYSPETCSWVTRSENCRHRRPAKGYKHRGHKPPLECKGLVMTQAEWARRLNITQGAICRWLKRGKPFEELVSRHY